MDHEVELTVSASTAPQAPPEEASSPAAPPQETPPQEAPSQETPDGDVIAIRPVMNMVLAIDHRANDGAQAAAFLKVVKTWLEAIGPETPVH